MDNETKKLLQDILMCIQAIEHYIGPKRVFVGTVIRFALLSVLAVVSAKVDAQTDEDFIEVKKIWNEFADRVIQKDFNGLRHISSDTIFCPSCNTPQKLDS
jgi:hypothetical protein